WRTLGIVRAIHGGSSLHAVEAHVPGLQAHVAKATHHWLRGIGALRVAHPSARRRRNDGPAAIRAELHIRGVRELALCDGVFHAYHYPLDRVRHVTEGFEHTERRVHGVHQRAREGHGHLVTVDRQRVPLQGARNRLDKPDVGGRRTDRAGVGRRE